MNNQPQGQAPQGQQNGQQQQQQQQSGQAQSNQQFAQRAIPTFRPEHMRNLPPSFSADEKLKWENGLQTLYNVLEQNEPGSQQAQEAKKKIQDFSMTLNKKIISLSRPQASQQQQNVQQQNSTTGTAGPQPAALQQPQTQGQADGNGSSQVQPTQRPQAGAPGKPNPPRLSENMQKHADGFKLVLPQDMKPDTAESAKYITEQKGKYSMALLLMENMVSNLKSLTASKNNRDEKGQPLNEGEMKNFEERKAKFQKSYSDAKNFVTSFRQTHAAANPAPASAPANAANQPQAPSNNGPPGPPRPSLNPQQPNSNSTAQQNTQTVNAAFEAARNQQQMGAQRQSLSMPQTDPMQMQHGAGQGHQNGGQGMQNVQGQQNGPGQQNQNAQGHQMGPAQQNGLAQQNNGQQIKIEGGQMPTPLNTNLATAPHMQQQRQMQNSPQTAGPQSATLPGQPRPLSHQAALQQSARSYSNSQAPTVSGGGGGTGTPSQQQVMSQGPPSLGREPALNTVRVPISKFLPASTLGTPQPVNMPPARPTMSGGANASGNGMMGQPTMQKVPAFDIQGEGERVMNKKKLDELVRQVTGGGEGLDSGEGLTADVEECVLSVADEFVDQVITAACRCAKARGSKTLEIRDIQLILERNYNIRIPGYASDEIRTVRKFQPAQGWIAKMSAIQAAKVTGGKGDL